MKFLQDINRRTILLTLLKILISAGLLTYLLQKADLSVIATTLKEVEIKYYLYAIAVFFISQPLKTIRWGLFLKQKHVHVSQAKLLALYFIGMFFNTFLPTILAGDAVRTYYIYRQYHSKEIPATSVIIERFCGLFTLFVIGMLSSVYWIMKFGPDTFTNTSFSVCLAAIITMLFFISPLLHRHISRLFHIGYLKTVLKSPERIYRSFQGYAENRKVLFAGFALSFLTSFSTIITGYCLSLSLSWEIPFHIFFFAIPIITVATMLPVSFGGVGVRESAFFLVFSQFEVAGSSAVALALLWYSINLISGALGGLCYVFLKIKPDETAKNLNTIEK